MCPKKEGFITAPGGKIWYQVVGKHSRAPLIVVHGGPGYPHDYLQPLDSLSDQRQIVFYDQLGCGKSDKPTDKKLWTVQRFIEELAEVVKSLKFQQYCLLGHSWGASLASGFALQKPKGLTGLILADPYLSTPIWLKDANRLISLMPINIQKALNTYIDINKETEEYKFAKKMFYNQFVRGYKKSPPEIVKSRAGENNDIYNFMWGPEEFLLKGSLKNFDLTPKLPEITIPVLLLAGRVDEATPEAVKYFHKLLQKSEVVIFEKSAHFPHLTERSKYIHILRLFLKKADIR